MLVDQIGYEAFSSKEAVVSGTVEDHPDRFELLDEATGATVLRGDIGTAKKVEHWGRRVFWKADFSSWNKPGHYKLRVTGSEMAVSSSVFEINDDLLERNTLSNVIFYFKGQRSTGLIDEADRHLALPGNPDKRSAKGYVDLHGGWYDATGDYGIHLSHQNPTSYFNPQQVSLVAWSLLTSYLTLSARKDDNFSEYERRLLDEGLYGADFLVRMKRPGGSFFETISSPGKRQASPGSGDWKPQLAHANQDEGNRFYGEPSYCGRAARLRGKLPCRRRNGHCRPGSCEHHAGPWGLQISAVSERRRRGV